MKKTMGLFIVMLYVFSVCSAFGEDTVKIGVLASMTGVWANQGRETKEILDLLTEQVNARGGVLGKRIELVLQDDGSIPIGARTGAQKLVNSQVIGVIGPYSSTLTEISQKVFKMSDIIQMGSGGSKINLTQQGYSSFFRICPKDDEQSKLIADYIISNNYRKVALLQDGTSYAQGLAQGVEENLKSAGIDPVFNDKLQPGKNEYKELINTIRKVDPDILVYSGYYKETALLLNDKREIGMHTPMIGGNASFHHDLIRMAGDAAYGYLFTTATLAKDLNSAEAKMFIDAYIKKYGHAPESANAIFAGEGFNLLVEGIRIARSENVDDVIKAIKGLNNYPGITGNITFDNKGDRIEKQYRIYKVDQNGIPVLQKNSTL